MLVNLKKRVKIDGKWTFLAVPRKLGRFQPERVTEPGTFYVEWRENGKRKQVPAGKTPKTALESLTNKQRELDESAPQVPSTETTLADACAAYLRNVKATRSEATHDTYSVQTEWFLGRTQKRYVSEIAREDIIDLFGKGRDEGSNQKTINKRIVVILGALRNAGSTIKLRKGDWPKTSDPDPEAYDIEDLKVFFEACPFRERVMFSVFLHTGFRHMEVATLQWRYDVDWKAHALRVRLKPSMGFQPKSYEWRSVRVPKAMMTLLETWQGECGSDDLMFPSPAHPKRPHYGGGIDYHMLETCKSVAEKCGFDSEHWYLHKFRHTFATNMLRSGVDIKTLQTLMGHKSLATTEKYLQALRLHDLESKIESSTLAGLLT